MLKAEELAELLIGQEGCEDCLYLDTHGLVTTGIGNLLKTVEDAQKLPWIRKVTGQPAGEAEIASGYHTVAGAEKGRKPAFYARLTDLRLTQDDIEALAVYRLEHEFLPGLAKLFTDFENYPQSAQVVLVDLAYNLGVHGLSQYAHLRQACAAGDWVTASKQCSTSTSRKTRNDWRRDGFLDAAGLAAGPSDEPSEPVAETEPVVEPVEPETAPEVMAEVPEEQPSTTENA